MNQPYLPNHKTTVTSTNQTRNVSHLLIKTSNEVVKYRVNDLSFTMNQNLNMRVIIILFNYLSFVGKLIVCVLRLNN
jgi:hypothetical protein